jgi:glycosyltransferase involved in cell wall biosynthesis
MTADTVGGVWDYALELARGLADRGVAVTLATMGRPPAPDQRREAGRNAALTLVESTYRLEWMEDPWEDVARAGAWLQDLAAANRPDIVHLNGYAHGALDWPAPSVVVGHSCACSWFEAVRRSPAPREWDRYRRAVAAGLRGADAVVAPSRPMLRALEAHYGATGGTVIPNGRSAAHPTVIHKRSFVLCAGRAWDPAKNLEAVAAVADRLSWPVYAAGDTCGPDGRAVTLRGVRCLGRLPSGELAGWVAQAAIFAAPARYEPFGLSILEAALAGCALVLGDIPSLRAHWDGAATFVAPDDHDALAAALERCIRDEGTRVEHARRARARAAAFSSARMTRAYVDLYASVMDMPRRARSGMPCAS